MRENNMLDGATVALLVKLKMSAKKAGNNIDLVRMSDDRGYAELTLKELSNADDADLVLIVVQLMNLFGMISAPSTSKSKKDQDNGRYIGALR